MRIINVSNSSDEQILEIEIEEAQGKKKEAMTSACDWGTTTHDTSNCQGAGVSA
jgi:hypothetical protein